jgi:hypothetical protein
VAWQFVQANIDVTPQSGFASARRCCGYARHDRDDTGALGYLVFACSNFGHNLFVGPVPDALAVLPAVNSIDLANNSFTGDFPASFWTNPSLQSLYTMPHALIPASAHAPYRRTLPVRTVSRFATCHGRSGHIRCERAVGLTLAQDCKGQQPHKPDDPDNPRNVLRKNLHFRAYSGRRRGDGCGYRRVFLLQVRGFHPDP